MSGTALNRLGLHARSTRSLWRARRPSVRDLFAPLDDRLVFVFGCPRSGTTFLAGAIGSCPGMVDLGEVPAFKAAIPGFSATDGAAAAPEIRGILTLTRRLGLTGSLRGIEQTPESVFVAAAIRAAFPQAVLIHVVRDGRDVVCSLLERGWLSTARGGEDDSGQRYGGHARFWVEPGRESEFERASDARRAAWAWRRYVEAGRTVEIDLEVRYERLASAREETATQLAAVLGISSDGLAAALMAAHAGSVGRFRTELDAAQVAEVEREAGALLHTLRYLQ